MTPAPWPAAAAHLLSPIDDLTRESAREAARRELSKRVYHRDDPTLVERALDWVVETVEHWLDAAVASSPGGLFGVVGLLALVVIAVVALRLRTGPLAHASRLASPLFGGPPRTAADHRAAADRHAAAGRWAEAVRERLRAVVRELEDRGVLDPRPGRTANEAAALGGQALPALAAELRAAVRVFDDVWYGELPATAAADAQLRALDESVRTAPRTAPVPAAGREGGVREFRVP